MKNDVSFLISKVSLVMLRKVRLFIAAIAVMITAVSLQAQEPTWQWVKSGGGTGSDAGTSITVDVNGNIYVTARFSGTSLFGSSLLTSAGASDVMVARYNSNGAILWAVRGGGTGNDEPNSISTDAAGNVFVTGSFTGT